MKSFGSSQTQQQKGSQQNPRGQNQTPSETMKTSENVQVLLDSLRDNYIIYKEYAMRCHMELRTQNSTEAQKYFYFPPKIPLLEEPEKQKVYRKKFIQDITSLPEPEPLVLIADVLHKTLLETIGDRSNPNITRQDLALFYKRRLASLQHKKHKILNRWSNQIMTSEYIDKTSLQLDQCMGRLQQEIDLSINRVERLSCDDNYLIGKTGQRPHPTAKEEDKEHKPLYLESNTQSLNSSIRLDDVETILRIQTYRNKIFRLANKLVTDIKWLPYSGRYDIWSQSRYLMIDYKDNYNKRRFKVFNEVAKKIRAKLELNGVVEEKVITQIIDKFTKHLKGQDFQTRSEQIQNSHKADYETPPILVSNILELKIYLLELAKEFGITGDLEIDSGHSFTYQVQVFFPTHYQKQILQLQFDWFDTGKDQDIETIEKLARNLSLNKNQALQNMSQFSEIERKKSIIGRINNDNNQELLKNGLNIDKSKFENIEFFTLDDTDYKLKKADWLDQICFQANIQESVKRQSHYLNQQSSYDSLLESAFNFLDVNDGGAVNKIVEESSQTHAKRATQRNQLRSENPLFRTKEDDIQNNLKNAVKKVESLNDQIKIAEQPLLEPMPAHVVKAYYTLRYLKTRDYKIKLLHILNYYRSIQKRLAMDVSQFCSKERAVIDLEIINPQFGKDSNGNPRSMLNGNNGPGNIFQNHIARTLDDPDNDKDRGHPASIKSLKYQKRFNQQVSSTCPCVPILHVTFGRPRLYEEVSEAIDNQKIENNPSKQSRLYTGRQDKIVFNKNSMDIQVFDEFGIKVIYEECMNDMLEIEEELMKIGSFYINKHEFILDSELKEPQSAIDRAELAYHLMVEETNFQFEKAQLLQQFMECYEHVHDPLEQVRIIQVVADLMAQRPRLNLEATYFLDSYRSEIEVIKQKRELYRELVDLQVEIEQQENTQIRKFQELKFRKIQEHMQNLWSYNENMEREEKIGSADDEKLKAPVTDKLKDRLEQKGIVDPEKRQRMKDIAQRHITEYANNQYMDFQDVLGIPEVTAEQLFKNQGQKEPLIQDTLREHAFFKKQMDGYPWYFSRKSNRVQLFGISERHLGLLDFYESMSTLSQVNAALSQSLEELINTHKPENGMAISCLDKALIIEARGKLKIIRNITIDSDYLVTKSTPMIEEDLYFQSSDKMMFLMREFKAQMHPEIIYEKSNPILIAKLDIDSVTKFNFPRLKQSDIKNNDELSQEEIVTRMINMAKRSVVSMTQEEKLIGGNLHIEDFMEKKGKSQLPEIVNQPSMLNMSCNLIETLRLREELIQRIHETDVLSMIYKSQLKVVNKDSFKLVLQDSINFDTQSITKDNMNLIDFNDGNKMEFDLAFREFDSLLKANLDFKSESCIKALMLDLGVEELRAVLHYQIMQQQILHVAVQSNQAIMDGCQRGLHELDFLTKKRQISVPNPREVGDFIYSINSKKSRQRPYIIKRYTNVLAKVQTFTCKPEVKLRILRSYRIKLCHSYCKDILREVYQDSLKIQNLQTANQLRIRSRLLPKDANIFHIGLGGIYENVTSYFIQNSKNLYKNHQKFNLSMIMNSKFDTIFYIPSSDEVMDLESRIDETKELQLQNQAQFTDQINEQLLDQQIKDMVKLPTPNVQYKLEDGLQKPLRKVGFSEAYQYSSQSLKLMNYLVLVLRIFNLEYLMGRNNSPGLDVLEMEDQILTGRLYWEKDKENACQNVDYSNQAISDIVINRIVNQRRARIDLSEDLNQISQRLQKLNEWPKKFTLDNLRVDTIIELLNSQHQLLYNQFLYGLEALEDIYLDKRNDECFAKTLEVKQEFIRQRRGLQLYSNGFDLSLVNVNGLHQNLDLGTLQDNQEFAKVYQPVVDEDYLIPQEISLVKNMYSQEYYLDNQYQFLMTRSFLANYSSLENCFLNMKDSERAYIFTNFYQVDELMQDYLIFKGVNQDKLISPQELINHKLEFLQLKNEQKLLQKILMTWISQQDLPKDTLNFEKLLKTYKDQVLMKILQERDLLNEQHQKQKDKADMSKKSLTQSQAEQGVKVQKEDLFEALNQNMQTQHTLDKVNERKAEINVIRRELEIRLIKHSISIIKNEHTSLLATFEQVATEKDISIYVHPQQQFASTLYQSVDRNSHLDISTKISFVQQFLTRLRNRCTEVETLTSGPGVVFSMKDFNECLQTFCKGLLKYGEQELRTRVETQFLKENQYKHLIYLKDQQCLYYRRKCEAFLTDIDKLINSKLTQKGNQIIYELDVSNRELRMLKDNFYMMEKLMRQEIRHEYERAIQERENTIQKFKESFQTYKHELNNEIKEEVAKEILSLDKKVKTIVKKDTQKIQSSFKVGQLSNRQYGLSNTNQFSDYKQLSNQSSNAQLMSSGIQQFHSQGYYDAESRGEINSLNKFIRKFKILTKMKEVLTLEKHERELYNQRQKLTSNECLWEQLAEAEKREQIIRQELYYTQQSLASYEKLIEKLQQQLENLQNQKLRLQQYKNSKSKRIDELESKMRDIEILENIDLNKVLEELRMRDKKLQQFQQSDQNFGQKLEVVNKANDKKIKEIQRKFQQEKDMKQQALSKLDNLRIEMRALEGRDFTNDLWKDKCKELFDICKDLQSENDSLKVMLSTQQTQHQQQAQLIQQEQQQKIQSSAYKSQNTFSPMSNQQKITIPSDHNPTTKPSTAAGANGGAQSRLYSRGNQGIGGISGMNQMQFDPTIMTSGLSLPDINNMDIEDKTRQLNPTSKKSDFSGQAFKTQMNFQRNNRSKDITLKSNQGPGSDVIMANAFTSTGTMSEQTRKFGQTGFINFGNNRASMVAGEGMGQGIIEKDMQTVNSGDLGMIAQSGFRNNATQVFGSQQISKSQSRGTALVAQQQTKFKQKRLKTSQGGRRPVNEANFTQTTHGAAIHNFQDTVPVRKSGMNFQRNQNITATNFVGQQIAHGIMGSSILSQSNMFKDNRGSINHQQMH